MPRTGQSRRWGRSGVSGVETETLATDLIEILIQQTNLERVLSAGLNALCKRLRGVRAVLYVYEGERFQLRSYYGFKLESDDIHYLNPATEQDLHVLQQGAYIYHACAPVLPDRSGQAEHTVLAVPLRAGEQLIGYVWCWLREYMTRPQAQALSLIGQTWGQLILRFQLQRLAEKRAEALQRQRTAAESVSAWSEESENTFACLFAAELCAEQAWLWLPDGQYFVQRGSWGTKKRLQGRTLVGWEQGLGAKAFEQRRLVWHKNGDLLGLESQMQDQMLFCFALIFEDTLLGFVYAASVNLAPPSQEQRHNVRVLASHLVGVLKRQQSVAEQIDLSEHTQYLMDLSPNLVVTFDLLGHFYSVNWVAEPMLGYPPGELIGRAWRDVLHPEDEAIQQENFAAMLRGQTVRNAITRYLHRSGRVVWIEWNSCLVTDKALFYAVGRDITARHTTEQERAMMAAALEQASDAIMITAATEHQPIIYVNAAFEHQTGYLATELVGHPPQMLYDTTGEQTLHQVYKQLLRGQAVQLEMLNYRKDGSTFWVELSVHALYNYKGERTHWLSVRRDITERRLASEHLQRSEARYRSLTQNSSDLIMLLSSEGEVLYQSTSAQKILGVNPEVQVGSSLLENTHPEDLPVVWRMFSQLRQGQETQASFRFLRADGNWCWLDAVGSNLLADPNVQGLVINARDATERKNYELEITDLNQRLQQQVRRLTALHRIDRSIASNLDILDTFDVLLRQTIEQLQVDASALWLLSEHNELEYVAGFGFHTNHLQSQRWAVGEGVAGRACAEQTTIHASSTEYPQWLLTSWICRDEHFLHHYATPLFSKGALAGVLEVYTRRNVTLDEVGLEFLQTLAGQAGLALEKSRLWQDLQQSNRELSEAYNATIEGWARALDLRDKETEGHSRRVTDLTVRLARRFGIMGKALENIRRGALLHDIGKMGIPDQILLKQGRLSEEEWNTMRKHPEYAYEMLLPIAFLRNSLDIPYAHHEKWDGSGYPRGLKGEEIPLSARLFSIVDVWDALRSNRPYRTTWEVPRVCYHLQEQAGIHFDPKVVQAFLELIAEDYPTEWPPAVLTTDIAVDE